jgi:hypothetical protein
MITMTMTDAVVGSELAAAEAELARAVGAAKEAAAAVVAAGWHASREALSVYVAAEEAVTRAYYDRQIESARARLESTAKNRRLRRRLRAAMAEAAEDGHEGAGDWSRLGFDLASKSSPDAWGRAVRHAHARAGDVVDKAA